MMSSDMSEEKDDCDNISGDEMTDAVDSSYACDQGLEQEWGEGSQTIMDIDGDDPVVRPVFSCEPPKPGLAFKLAHRTRSWTKDTL